MAADEPSVALQPEMSPGQAIVSPGLQKSGRGVLRTGNVQDNVTAYLLRSPLPDIEVSVNI